MTYVYTLEDLKNEFRLTSDGDHWGNTMGWLFRIADSLTFHHDEPVPSEWEFRPSPFGRADDPEDDYIAEIVDQTDPEELTAFGTLLWRVRALLIEAGRDY